MPMLFPPDICLPETADALINCAISSGDLHSAAAVYELAEGEQKQQLSDILCKERRNTLLLARWEHTPAAVLQMLAEIEDETIRLRLDKNPSSRAGTLNTIYKKGGHDRQLISLLTQHAHSSSTLLNSLAMSEDDIPILKSIAAHPNTDANTLNRLEQRYPDMFDNELAVHAETPPELLEKLYQRGNCFIRSAVVTHIRCPQFLLDLAFNETDINILRHLAANPRLSPEKLAILAQHDDVSVLRTLAGNPSLSKELANQMIHNSTNIVRRALASRTDLTDENLQQLANDEDHWVRQRVARHPQLDEMLLNKLAQDQNDEARRAVTRN